MEAKQYRRLSAPTMHTTLTAMSLAQLTLTLQTLAGSVGQQSQYALIVGTQASIGFCWSNTNGECAPCA